MSKRRELLDLEDYLFLFDTLEHIFIKTDTQKTLKPILDYYSNQTLTTEHLERFVSQLKNINTPEISRVKQPQQRKTSTLAPNQRNSMRKNSFTSSNGSRASLDQKSEDENDRVIIRGKLELYYQKHANGPDELIQKLVKIFSEMRFFSSSLQNQYEDLIKLKNQKNNNLDNLTRQLEELVYKNPKAFETTESKLFLLEEEEGCGILSDDTLQVPAIQIKPNSNITTVNVIRNYVNSRTKADDLEVENKKLIGFSTKIYIFLIFAIQRMCKTVKLIADVSKEIPSSLMENTHSTLKHIEVNFQSHMNTPMKEPELKISQSQSQNIFNFLPEDNKSDGNWHISTPKPLRLHKYTENSETEHLDSHMTKFSDKNNMIKKILNEIFENCPVEILNFLNKKIKEVISKRFYSKYLILYNF